MFNAFIALYNYPLIHSSLAFLGDTWFVWLPFILIVALWDVWVQWRRAIFMAKQNYVLLEIKLPREILKSPRAAEFFIAGLWKTDYERNFTEKYWKGQTRQDYSLEIASIDGAVHFFVWTRKAQQSIIEANLYSQYPGIEVFEVPDYTLPVTYDPATSGLSAFEFDLAKPDAFPIKTYVDYGMDKDPKEEYKIDPLTPLIEFMGSLGRGQQAWLQIILRAHKEEDKDPETGKAIDLKWKDAAQGEIDKILKKAKGDVGPDGKIVPGTGRFLNDIETETIKALGRSVSKPGFDVGIRIIYTAPKDIFVGGNIGGMIGGVVHFNSHLNGFKPARGSGDIVPFFNKYFKISIKRSDKKRDLERQDMLDAYKHRAYFYEPFRRPHFVLNTEELATLYHFPSLITMMTPTVERIASKKGEAPANLPQ